MHLTIVQKKRILYAGALLAIVLCLYLLKSPAQNDTSALSTTIPKEEIAALLERIFAVRNEAMIDNDQKTIERLYNKQLQNGLYAYEHEAKKLKYLHNWAQKQGVTFTSIDTYLVVNWANSYKSTLTVNFMASTEYCYTYENQPEAINKMRIGTYHEMSINSDRWLITKEWYTDPFADSLNLENLKKEENKTLILSNKARDFSNINERRKKAVEYADRYCGAASSGENDYKYNKKYRNYNSLGGDCANFASQILHEGGKFRKSGGWNYEKDGNRAWLNARALKDYMLHSGRGSLIASGSYNKVLASSYKLLPGDLVVYEKMGKVVHVSVATGADSRGYALVNCHNTDRYRVPWDLGWSDSSIKFYLIRVHY